MVKDTARLTIRIYPDPSLRRMSEAVRNFDKDLARLAERMLQLMRENNGVGLAAPQVGVPLRLFVCNVSGEPADDRVFINPRLTLEGDMITSDEGCLSIPDVTVAVMRHQRCAIEAVDVHGKPVRLEGADLTARCWQHECDHLDGRLIIDRMSEADRIANRRPLKDLEAGKRKKSKP